MSFLEKARLKKRELLKREHILASEDISFRYAYVCGIATLAGVDSDGVVNDQERKEIAELAYSLSLSDEETIKAIVAAEKQDPNILDTIIEMVNKKEQQYAFVLDLYKAMDADNNKSDEEQELINIFLDMMKFTDVEKQFIQDVAKAISVKDNEIACNAIQELYNHNIEPPINILKFFMPELEYQEVLDGFSLKPGEVRQLKRPTLIKGVIEVPAGSRLIIKDVDLIFKAESSTSEAGIRVKGGTLDLSDSTLRAIGKSGVYSDENTAEEVRETEAKYMISIEDVTNISISNTTFDGDRMTSAIFMYLGNLQVKKCLFKNMKSVKNGGSINAQHVKLTIEDSTFKDNLSLKDGGAVYLFSGKVKAEHSDGHIWGVNEETGSLFIDGCRFIDCEAKGKGGAVRINYSIGNIINSTFDNCIAESGGGLSLIGSEIGFFNSILGMHANQLPTAKINITKVGQCKFADCVASKTGGAISYEASISYNYLIDECNYINCKPNNDAGDSKHIDDYKYYYRS